MIRPDYCQLVQRPDLHSQSRRCGRKRRQRFTPSGLLACCILLVNKVSFMEHATSVSAVSSPASFVSSHHGNNIINLEFFRSSVSAYRTSTRSTRLKFALTEEFIKLKGKSTVSGGQQQNENENEKEIYFSNSANGNSNGINGNSGSTGRDGGGINLAINGAPNIISTSQKPFADKVGYSALATVQNIARTVGSGEYGLNTGLNNGLGEEGGVTGGMSGRAEYIAWQRNMLKETRRDILSADEMSGGWTGTSNAGSEGRNTGVNSGGVIGGSESRMAPLIAALPSSKKAAESSNNSSRGKGIWSFRNRSKESNNISNNLVGTNTAINANGNSDVKNNINSGNNGGGSNKNNNNNGNNKKDSNLITLALSTLEKDMSLLDNLASLQPQLSGTEVGLLLGAVAASGMGPIVFPGTSVTEVLAPAAAAFTASITIGSEYIGRVAVADGKEIAANTIQCAAEAEALLANAERVKAITPLCVGVGATAASLSLLAPTIIETLKIGNSVQVVTELYLFCPLVSVLAAAVANLALEETRGFCSRAINVGVRRFAKSGVVGRTWLSSSEQVQKNSKSKTDRWWSFAGSVLPAPIIGSVVGGPSLSTKCIIIAALAAAQSAYFLALAEGVVARATDAVALKARSAAVCDTYANQGSRNSAILPFTSALSAFCAAATAAIVELPFIDTVSAAWGAPGEVLVVSFFPMLSSAFAAAAAVSKARCEVDAEAACQAASTLALEYDGMNGNEDDPVVRPFKAVRDLIQLALSSGWRSVRVNVMSPLGSAWRKVLLTLRLRRRFGGGRRWIKGGEGLASS